MMVNTGRTKFYEDAARKDAAMLYDHMYTMLNNTQNGTYTERQNKLEI
ncbi:MAG: hypothetical protein CM15mV42_0940 [uncultured marine virus]|nr:MAG: hypothetical protein CM15mV42_0940 [uncultured marine virus]